uniref:Progestin and adipoQ receptor family member 3-like n=1 Tax=Heterorhabditis bacteriophora TaxID=37862 RepID=A0A1I7XLY2_HETBA
MLSASEIPLLLKRSHIVSGYRPLHQPRQYYYKSAFCSHNEVINVWSHFLPAICLMLFYVRPELSSESRLPVLILHTGIATLFFGSAFAHLLIYLPLLLVIVLGLQFCSTCYLFVSRPHWPRRLELRMATCLLLALWLYVPLIYRYLSTSSSDPSLHLHTRAFHWLLISGIFMGASVPERFAPGKFDIFGYGHQFFHFCIIMMAWNLCDAAHIDCTSTWSTSDTKAIACAFLLTCAFVSGTVYHLTSKAKRMKYE